MKKFYALVLAMLMALGISSVASAAITFDIDFYGEDFYGIDWEQGVMDTGDVITLKPCQTINVDLWVRGIPGPAPDNGVGGFGFGFGVMPGAEINFEIEDWAYTYPIIDSGIGRTEIISGGLTSEALLWPPDTIWDGDFLMISFLLHCTKPSFDELWIYDYWPDSAQWVLKDGLVVLDGEILPQHLAGVNQVPIPGAVWLLGSGLLGFVGLRRKKRS